MKWKWNHVGLGCCLGLIVCPAPQRYLSRRQGKRLLLEVGSYRGLFPSLEHVVPVSVVGRGTQSLDLHNLMIINAKINCHRQNYAFGERSWSSRGLDELGNRSCDQPFCYKNVPLRQFTPPDVWKGLIARKVAYMLCVYPTYRPVIFRRVMDAHVLVKWNKDYEVSEQEEEIEYKVAEAQGNRNHFILSPEKVTPFIQSIQS